MRASSVDDEIAKALKKLATLDLDLDAAQLVLQEMYGESYVAGAWVAAGQVEDVADDAIKPSWLSAVDWDRWQPGNNAAARELAGRDGGRGLKAMLDEAGVTIKSVRSTVIDKLGRSLGEGMAGGENIRDLASRVTDVLGDPSRGEIIARTESARASSVASMDSFAENNITGKEWQVFDPCEVCEENAADGVIDLDATFTSGDTEPPAHPNCKCAVAPVIATPDSGE